MLSGDIKGLLEENALRFSQPEYISYDPIAVAHRFTLREDIEIAGFLTATIAWGQRPSILKNATRLLTLMGGDPYDYLMKADEDDFSVFLPFVHRTFNGWDAIVFMKALQRLYREDGGLMSVFEKSYREEGEIKGSIIRFRECFFRGMDPGRTSKHLADVSRNSSAKRINMFLRWMVRKDPSGFDFGLWDNIPSSALMIPLDLHSGRVARELGLLKRKQNDWKAVEELTTVLRTFDPEDPVKYDFALFGLGAYEKWGSDGQ